MKNYILFATLLAGTPCLAASVKAEAKPAAKAKDQAVLATVNGVDITRVDAMNRAWKQYGTAVLNEMADEILIKQAAEALKVAADPAEVDSRLKRIKGQFQDEAAFTKSLAARGLTLDDLRAQISTQVLRESLVVKYKGLSVSESDAKDFFAANKEKLGAPEAVHLRHILVASEKEAADFLASLKAGADFSKLASQVSLDGATKDRGGDLGFVSKGMLQADIEAVVFALKPGETSAAVKTGNGFQVFKVEESRAAKAAVYEDIKSDLMKALLADKVSKAWPGYLEELRSKAKYQAGR